jgi:sRNA-binding carbon storage regulator CsrA
LSRRHIQLREGESITVDGLAVITLLQTARGKCRVQVEAPVTTRISQEPPSQWERKEMESLIQKPARANEKK